MKKLKYVIPFCLLISLILSGCYINLSNSIFEKNKPSKSYYTYEMLSYFKKENPLEVNVLYVNFYRGKRLDEGEILTLRKFFKYLKKDNFIEKPKDLPKAPEYKIFVKFKNNKYVLDIYNNNYISLYPWDGNHEKDYITMKDTYTSYNIFNLCEYVISHNK